MNRFFSTSLAGIAAALAAGILLRIFIFDVFLVEGNSMSPFVSDGNVVIINRMAYGIVQPFTGSYLYRWRAPEPNDVVFFLEPTARKPSIKRCAWETQEGYYLIGDNTEESLDSRIYGSVAVEKILGKVLFSFKR